MRYPTNINWIGLMREQGVVQANEEPTDEEVRRFDTKRTRLEKRNALLQNSHLFNGLLVPLAALTVVQTSK